MTFREQMVADAAIFVETDEFGETIEFANDGTNYAEIEAQVFRDRIDATQSDRNIAYQHRAVIYIRRADVSGQVNDRKARARFKLIENGEDSGLIEWIVSEITTRDDPALWRLVMVA